MELQNEVDFQGWLPFQWHDETWGEIKHVEEECPGVYYLATSAPKHIICREMYAVIPGAVPDIISEEAWGYGKETADGVRVFECNVEDSGWEVVHYELLRYRTKHGIPRSDTDPLYCSAIYAADQYPDYFGGPIPPRCTPWGLTVRCKKAAEGLFFLETNRCEWVLALSYPVWSVELSDVAQRLGERCELDRQMGEDEAEYLYFKRDACAPAIYELLGNSEYGGLLGFIHSKEALETHLNRRFPEYVVWHNSVELSGCGLSDILENLLGAFGCRPEESEEKTQEKQALRVANCIHYTPELEDMDYLLLPQ